MGDKNTIDSILARADAEIAARKVTMEKSAAAKAPAQSDVREMAAKLEKAAQPEPQPGIMDKIAEALIITETLAAINDFAPVASFIEKAAAAGHNPDEALRFCLVKQAAAMQSAGRKMPTILKALGATAGLAGAGWAGKEYGEAAEEEENQKVLQNIGGQVAALRSAYQGDVVRAYRAGLEQGQA